MPNRRPRQVDTSHPRCPHANCADRGWVGLGNLRANGHPNGAPWRQFHCPACGGYVLETHGTILHGKRVALELIVRLVSYLAQGLGLNGTVRVFEVDPNTGLPWRVEAAAQPQVFSRSFLQDVHLRPVQLHQLFALFRAVKDGKSSEAEVLAHLDRVPNWVWVAMAPGSTLRLSSRSH